jgi:hypothetical protein
MPYVLIQTMYSRVNCSNNVGGQSPVGSVLRVLNLSLGLLPGSGIALLLLISGAGSG